MAIKNLKPVLIAMLLSIGGSLLMNLTFSGIYSGYWYASVLFHIVVSFLVQLLLFRKTDDQRDYTFKIMFASMGRLLFCMIGLLVYKLAVRENFTQFALHFMLHYILFTIFEIAYLLKFIKNPKP